MPKGATCPSCGNFTYQTKKAIRECTVCHAVGWGAKPEAPGAGRGAKCMLCNQLKKRQIGVKSGVHIWHCYGCNNTHMTFPTAIPFGVPTSPLSP
jgi:hypothetical protein